jgi:non-specific serine/threonine protein kinase
VAESGLSFADLLRRLRNEARLTQEELAEAASLSPRSVSDLERGINRTAHRDTALLLASALGLAGPVRDLFVTAARGRVPAAEVLAARAGTTQDAVLRQQGRAPAPSVPHNLPAPLTSFLDREQALARLDKLLGEVRLVTLTGTGGAGKTRLALEVGARALGRFPDGVWLTDLAGVTDPGLVAVQVMEALGGRQTGDAPVLETLRFRLRSADLLLVLDNCEHLLDGCVQLAHELLASSPGLRVLATSREPLGLPGEVTYLVPPMELPTDPSDVQATATAPAVRLFLERGSAARGGSESVVPVEVAERICRKLDGLPLAIELAAARLGTLSAAEIEAHLTDRFRFLVYRRPAAHRRHQALQAAMEWSYELLTVTERQVFGELSVFAGTFGLEQAAMVCGADQAEALEVIDRLAVKSLVSAEPAEEGTRYRLLETVRQYAAERLAEAGETEAVRQRHALAYLAVAEQDRQLAVLAREHDNFRAALDWALLAGHEAGPRLARALGDFWLGRGLLQEGRDWLDRALARPSTDGKVRAGLLCLLGIVLFEAGDLRGADAVLSEGLETATAAGALAEQARLRVQLTEIRKRHNLPGGGGTGALEECEAAIAVLDAAGDLRGLAEGWLLAGKLHFDRAEWPAALEAMQHAIAFGRQSGNHRAWIMASTWLGSIFMMSPIPAETAVERVEELLHEVHDEPYAQQGVLMALGQLYAYTGRFADARGAIERSRAIISRSASKLALAFSAFGAGEIEVISGDPAAAERGFREGYEAFLAMGERGYLGILAGLLAEALYAQGRFDEAQQMIEEAETTAGPSETDAMVLWRSVKAKVLARRGQFPAAWQLIAQAEAEISSTSWVNQAAVLMAKAEVSQLAGALDQAAASLQATLRIYEERHVLPLAEQVKVLLASLTANPGQTGR